jgi:gluconate 2-dehydrogenase gamma chain
MGMTRREMLRLLAGTAVPLASALSADMSAFGREVHAAVQSGTAATALRSLDERSARIVTAVCERIIPTDETPGAIAAGVPHFIDRVLTDWCDASQRRLFLDALLAIDARSRSAYGAAFADRSDVEQTALLSTLDDEYSAWQRTIVATIPTPGVQSLPAHGFGMLKFLTVWGYFTSDVGQERELRLYPRPTAYDGCAPYAPRRQPSKRVAQPRAD